MSDISKLKVAAVLSLLAATGVTAGELTDPTRPSYLAAERAAPVKRAPSWHVESIIVSPGRRLAVVNGRTVSVDDWIGGARVTEILPYEVRLEYQGEIRRISLVSTRVKRPANR